MSLSASKRQQVTGQMAVLGAAFFWSTSCLFIKLLDMHPIVISGLRSFIAFIFLLAVRLISPPPKAKKNPPHIVIFCGLALAFTIYTFVAANKLTTAANSILLQYSAPIWAAILASILIKEKPHWEHWAAVVFVMGGLVLFFRGGLDSGAFLGNALAIISGVLLAAHTVTLRMLKDGNTRDAMLIAHAITAGLSIPFIILYPPTIKVSTVLPLLFMGFFQMGVASLLLAYGIKRIPAIQAMLASILDPTLSPVWVLVVTGERPSLWSLVGGLIIISSVIASSIIGLHRDDST